MIQTLIQAVFGTKSQRDVRRLLPVVQQAADFETQIQALSDEGLKRKTEELKARVAERLAELPEKPDAEILKEAEREALQDVLPEAFAAVREAARRAIGLRHFDVQFIG